jgi:undecaprenyl-diphosphatase
MTVTTRGLPPPAELAKTGVLAAALSCLTADVLRGGVVSSTEARLCRPFGPAPRWARVASRLPERDTLALVLVGAVANRLRTGRPVAAPVVGLGGGALARAALASVVRRRRPPESWWRAQPHGWSFPSRHTTHALLIAATVAEELGALTPRARAAVLTGCTCAVGLSRVRLGVHWPSDVAGGVLAGALWLRLTGTRPSDRRGT